MRNEEGIDKDALSNLVLGPLSVVASCGLFWREIDEREPG